MQSYPTDFLQKLRSQDPWAFGQVYDSYVDQFFRYIKWHYTIPDAQAHDIVSDIFVKIWGALPRLDVTQSFSWRIWTVARNTLKDYFKKHTETHFAAFNAIWHDDEAGSEAREDTLADPKDFLKWFHVNDTFERIQEAMNTLEETYKLPLYFVYVEEMSYEEVALHLAISQEAVRQRLSRGLKKLQEKLSHLR